MSDPTQISVFQLMKSRMQMLGERQKVIAQNVANVSTPGYVPGDIDQKAFAATWRRITDRARLPCLSRNPLTPKPRSTATPWWSKSR